MDTNSSQSTLRLDDFLFILFRRKWLILLFCLAGVAGAAYIVVRTPPQYTSTAKLLLRYIREEQEVLPIDGGDRIREVDPRGDAIINTEIEILTSWDLAIRVAESVSPERIIGDSVSNATRATSLAAREIVKGLKVEVPLNANVIRVRFSHPNPDVAQIVLGELIEQYRQRHAEIHLAGFTYDSLQKQTDKMKLRLRQTEDELLSLRNQAGGVSVEEAKRTFAGEIAAIRSDLLSAEAQLAMLMAVSPNLGFDPDSMVIDSTNSPSSSDESVTFLGTNFASVRLSYQALLSRLQDLRIRERDYGSRYTEQNPLVKGVQRDIAELEEKMDAMSGGVPQMRLPDSAVVAGDEMSPADLMSQAPALQARIEFLRARLIDVRTNALKISGLERSMSEFLLEKETLGQSVRDLDVSLERERFNSALESGRISNINVAQKPSPPTSDSGDSFKQAGFILVGGVLAGLAVAVLIELFLDPRVKRLADLERGLRFPVSIAVPQVSRSVALQVKRSRRRLRDNEGDQKQNGAGNGASELLVALKPYYEVLRDRLILHFESVNLRRKPKLIGIAGCHGGAGVSSMAEGLAATLSETGGGKVLLVDMNDRNGAAHPYNMGRPALKLQDVLENAETEPSEVHSNGEGLSLAALGKSTGTHHPARSREFDQLIPRLKSSDLDYIVFDLPTLNETSVSYRLAGFLDKVLVVVEAEKTHSESVKRAASMLAESRASVSLVLNKSRQHMPRWLQPPE